MLRSWRDAALHLVPASAGMQGFCSPPHPSSRMSESIVSLMIQSGICTFCLFASCSNDNHKSNAPFPPSWFPTSGLLDLRVPLLKVEPALKNHRPPPVGSSSLGICRNTGGFPRGHWVPLSLFFSFLWETVLLYIPGCSGNFCVTQLTSNSQLPDAGISDVPNHVQSTQFLQTRSNGSPFLTLLCQHLFSTVYCPPPLSHTPWLIFCVSCTQPLCSVLLLTVSRLEWHGCSYAPVL